ncbi:enolase C-terminal domain-like protein [Frateuria hangzhouensis]|uniref:enolase C-terminal domain-like protein n=1 Tax=Frateuria hangzhouensis TaxID=2995589 RepID=UPI002260EF57|nr:enolase C-terminal domain-like protein [Frateuria sp. STR12]MCX7512746.1 mandelate racemase [Frateuria sp. STR12]
MNDGRPAAPATVPATRRIARIEASAYRIPTDAPEADGTIAWNATTMVLARISACGQTGLGWTYAHAAAAAVIADPLRDCLLNRDVDDIPGAWHAMNRSLRNIGRPGVGLMAISALDVAMWDLKARLHGVAVVRLLGRARQAVPVYGSGGFTSYTLERLQQQLSGWVGQGMKRVKMKVGTHPEQDPARVHAARQAIGSTPELMVDGNGAYERKQALALAERYAHEGVGWFEEPVSSDDLEGLALLRDRAPAGMAIAAGEYGWDALYFRRMLQAGAVDVLQIDGTRCGGFTGFLHAAALAHGFGIPVSAHCAPHLHAHVCSTVGHLEHVEYFHDHARIESMFFDGLPELRDGALVVDAHAMGLGLTFKQRDAERYRVSPEETLR